MGNMGSGGGGCGCGSNDKNKTAGGKPGQTGSCGTTNAAQPKAPGTMNTTPNTANKK